MNAIRKRFLDFQDTLWFPAIYALFVFICNSLSLDIVGFGVAALLFIITLIVNPDTTKTLPIVMIGVFFISTKNSPYYSDNTYYLDNLWYCVAIGSCAVVGMVYRWIKSGRKSLKGAKFVWGLAALCAAYFLGGIFYDGYDAQSLLIALLFFFLLFVVYLFYSTTVQWNKKSFNWFCDVATIAVLTVVAQVLLVYVRSDILRETFNKSYVILGWGISNIIAATIGLILPFAMYQMSVKKHFWFYLAAVHAGMLTIVFTFSRTGLLAAGILYLAVAVYNVVWGANRKYLRICYGVVLVVLAVAFGVFFDQMRHMLNSFFTSGIDDSGRFELYKIGWRNFLKNPIFGTGLKYLEPGLSLNFWFLRYHNHFVQFLASTGVVGLCAYIFHRTQTLLAIFKKPTLKSLAVLCALFVFFVTSALDVAMFNPVSFFFYAPILVVLEKSQDFAKKETGPLENEQAEKVEQN